MKVWPLRTMHGFLVAALLWGAREHDSAVMGAAIIGLMLTIPVDIMQAIARLARRELAREDAEDG